MRKFSWVGRKAFVTGATGFVGVHIVRHLLEKGAQVICLQRDANRANSLDLFNLRSDVTLVSGVVEDGGLMERVLNKYEVEAVFHMAAQTLVGVAKRFPLATFESNIRGSYALLEACRRAGSVNRIVVASSYQAYGTNPRLPYTEEHPLLGVFPHDVSKLCADVLARCYAHTYGLPVAVARAANIYGPGDLHLSRIIPGTIVSVLRDQAPIIRSDGTPVRDFVYVDDISRAYLLLAERMEQVSGQALNFGSGEPVQVLDLVNRIIRLAGKQRSLSPQVMASSKISGEIDEQYLSAEKSETLLKWRPEIRLDEGLQRTMEWYRAHLDALAESELECSRDEATKPH